MPPRLTSALPVNQVATITVSIPTPLRNCCAGKAELSLQVASPRKMLEELERRQPELHRRICDETGKVRQHINLWINSDHLRDREGLDTQLITGDVVTIMTAVSGG